MTRLIQQAFEALGRMPIETQDDLARALLGYAEAGTADAIDPENLEAVEEGMAQAERGEVAAGSASEIVAAAFRHAW